MRCPKCQFDHPLQRTECLKCGIVFSKYKPPPGVAESAVSGNAVSESAGIPGAVAKSSVAAVTAGPAGEQLPAAVVSSFNASLDKILSPDEDRSPDAIRNEAVTEFKYRLFALPLALLVARWLTGTGFDMAAGMLAMVVHECGHAITAWLAGRWAVPMLWFTMIGENRSWLVVLLVTSALLFGGYIAWRARRWGWVSAAAAVLVLQMIILSVPSGALITFAGDGGAMVLATILMATFYASRDSAICKSWGLRWGLLVIGALAFMHVYRLWSGPWENILFGESEGLNLSDPSLLTELYGWSVIQLVDRYLLLAKACFTAMGAMYFWGLMSAYVEMRFAGPQRAHRELKAQTIR